MTPPIPPADAGRYLTVAELAARKGVPKSFIYKLVADGRITFFRRCPGGKLRFPPDALDQALTRPGVRPSPAPRVAADIHATPAAAPPRKKLPGRRAKWQTGGS